MIKLEIIATFFIFFSLIFSPNFIVILLFTIKLQATYRIAEINKKTRFEKSKDKTRSECEEILKENAQTNTVETKIIGTKMLFMIISQFNSLLIAKMPIKMIKIDHR